MAFPHGARMVGQVERKARAASTRGTLGTVTVKDLAQSLAQFANAADWSVRKA